MSVVYLLVWSDNIGAYSVLAFTSIERRDAFLAKHPIDRWAKLTIPLDNEEEVWR